MAEKYDFYEINDLTKRLGYQCLRVGTEGMLSEFIELEKLAVKDEPLNVYGVYNRAIDFYSLGVMHGKKIERERRRKSAQNQ